jgi:hypothetical protein
MPRFSKFVFSRQTMYWTSHHSRALLSQAISFPQNDYHNNICWRVREWGGIISDTGDARCNLYCHDFIECNYRRILDWWLDILNSNGSLTTSNCSRFTNSHTYSWTRHIFKSSQFVFTSRCLVTASNGTVPVPQLPPTATAHRMNPTGYLTNSLTNKLASLH